MRSSRKPSISNTPKTRITFRSAAAKHTKTSRPLASRSHVHENAEHEDAGHRLDESISTRVVESDIDGGSTDDVRPLNNGTFLGSFRERPQRLDG